MRLGKALCFVFSMSILTAGHAADFPIQGRIVLGSTSSDLSNVNQELQSLGLEQFGTIPQLGAEVTYAVLPVLEVGLSYTKRANVRKESGGNSVNDYKAELDQSMALAVARIPLIKSNLFRIDVFAGVGGSNTTLKIQSASQSGELSKADAKEWFASPVTRYGASAAVGYKGFYFVVEGGQESNKVESLSRTGTLGNNIQAIDLSGSYFTLGLLMDGIQVTKK